MNFIDSKILNYSNQFTSNQSKLLEDLERETQYKILMPRMLSGKMVGKFLSMVSQIKQPLHILEIGTYTGYSAICLAQGLQKTGTLHTIEINKELEDFALKYFKKANLKDKINLHIGNALNIIPQINLYFDIIFIDADKKNYCKYYDLAINKLNKGGLLIIDNVLWSGKVINEPKENDQETKEIQTLNKKILHDPRVNNILLPIRDGIMICQLL
ncbi:MAG: methyltransferase [Flavobacteriales bacterium]|nr:methyltransferase [Flavobacteriales bacterium]|tara:strand:- start:1986 stop:2627 length:642 start_codon:yes stop_codon:yes gene_type:complete